MTRRLGWAVMVLLLLATAWGQAPPPTLEAKDPGASTNAPATGQNASGNPAEQRVWFETGPMEAEERDSFRVRNLDEQPGDKPVVFECQFTSEHPTDDAILRLEITDGQGAVLHRSQTPIVMDKQGESQTFAWDAREVALGTYRARFEILRRSGLPIVRRSYTIRKVLPAQLKAEFDGVQEQIARLAQYLRAVETEGLKAPYVRARMAIAGQYIPPAGDALEKRDWKRADALVGYLKRAMDAGRAQLAFGNAVPELWEPIPQPSLAGLTARDGVLYAEGRPVFLLGTNFREAPDPQDISFLRRCGLNLAAFSVGPNRTLADANRELDFRGPLDSVFQRAEQDNVSVIVSLAPEAMCPWALDRWPAIADNGLGRADITQPEARQVIERHVGALVPYLASQKMLGGLVLLEKPAFRFSGETVREGFLQMVKGQYEDRHAVNQAWKGIFADLDTEVNIGWVNTGPTDKRYQQSPAYQYDWQTYHQRLGTAYIEWLSLLTRSSAPHTSLMAAFEDNAFEPKESELGIDREAASGSLDLSGCCAANASTDPYYALGYPQETMTYTLMRSFAPEKPAVNFEDRILDESTADVSCTFEYVHSVMWEAAIAGLSGSALWAESLPVRPECLDGYATACLDLNRLAHIVAAFQQAPAEVAILWSMPSKVYVNGVPHLASVRYAYEGCSFAGHKVRFITEKDIVKDRFAGVKVLVVPDTLAVADETFPILKEFMQETGTVIRTASSILYNEHGQSRRDIISSAGRTVLVRGQNLPAEYLHAMDALASVGRLPRIPRTVNEYDYPLEGVKSRYVELDGRSYLYLTNLRKEMVICYLHDGPRSGHDLVRGRDIVFPLRLEPLDPMLIRLNMSDTERQRPEREGHHY